MDVLAALNEAAERGVEVKVITNARPVAPTKLNWRFWETNMAGYGEFKGAGYKVWVIDCDGDYSEWTISRHGELIAEGRTGFDDSGDYYHFDAACLDAELVLHSLARAQRSRLKSRGIYARSRWAEYRASNKEGGKS